MDKSKNRTDLLAAGRKKLQQFRQKKDHKVPAGSSSSSSSSPGKSSQKPGKHEDGNAESVPHDVSVDMESTKTSQTVNSVESNAATGDQVVLPATKLLVALAKGDPEMATREGQTADESLATAFAGEANGRMQELKDLGDPPDLLSRDGGRLPCQTSEQDADCLGADQCNGEVGNVGKNSEMGTSENGRDEGCVNVPLVEDRVKDDVPGPPETGVDDAIPNPAEESNMVDGDFFNLGREDTVAITCQGIGTEQEEIQVSRLENQRDEQFSSPTNDLMDAGKSSEDVNASVKHGLDEAQSAVVVHLPAEAIHRVELADVNGEGIPDECLGSTDEGISRRENKSTPVLEDIEGVERFIGEGIEAQDTCRCSTVLESEKSGELGMENPISVMEDVEVSFPAEVHSVIKSRSSILRSRTWNREDAMEIFIRHLYLTSVTKEFLQLQLTEQICKEVESDLKLSNEVSRLQDLVRGAQEKSAGIHRELVQCKTELQVMISEKKDLEIQCLSARDEIEGLNASVLELQNELELLQKESMKLSADLDNCESVGRALQMENSNLAAQIISEREQVQKLKAEKELSTLQTEELSSRMCELQNKLELSRNESMEFSAQLADCKDVVTALQAENSNLTVQILSDTDNISKLKAEKDFFANENMKLDSALSQQKDQLAIALDKMTQLEGEFKETMVSLEKVIEENIYLLTNLDVHKSKIKELEHGFQELHSQARGFMSHAKNSMSDSTVSSNATSYCQTSHDNILREVSLDKLHNVVDSYLGQRPSGKVEEDDPEEPAVLCVLKGHLIEAEKMLQNLEKTILDLHANPMSSGNSGSRSATSGVSKLIQAFESKTHPDSILSDEVPLVEGEKLAISAAYNFTMVQVSDLRTVLKQMGLDAEMTKVLCKKEQDAMRIAREFEVKCETLALENNKLQGAIHALGMNLTEYKLNMNTLESQLDGTQQNIDEIVGRFLNQVESLHKEANGMAVAIDEEINIMKDVISGSIQKLDASTGLLVAGNLDINAHLTASVNSATTMIDALKEKLEAASMDCHRTHASYDELCTNYACLRESQESTIGILHRIHGSLARLIMGSSGYIEKPEPESHKNLMDAKAEGLQELPLEDFEILIEQLSKLLSEQLLLHSANGELESELALRNRDMEELKERCTVLSQNLEESSSTMDELRSLLLRKDQELDEVSRGCLALAQMFENCKMNESQITVPELVGGTEVIVQSDKMQINSIKQLLLHLDISISLLLNKYGEATEQLNLSKNCLHKAIFRSECSSHSHSEPLHMFIQQDIIPRFVELLELQEKMNWLSSRNAQQENEMQILKESLSKVEEALVDTCSNLNAKVSELEQSEQRLSSVREKLSIAVAKGKGLVVQRDSLKQSLMEKSSELERCLQELQMKESRLCDLETKLKSSEADRVEALESELSYIRNSATAFRDSFLQKDSVLQKIEEVMEELDLPEEFHSKDIVEKVEWLAKSVVENPSFPLTDWEQKVSLGGSQTDPGFVARDAWKDNLHSDSGPGLDDLKRKYEELQSRFYGLAEQNDMLEQSLMERNDLVQMWEKILDTIDMPLQLRSMEPEGKLAWLGRELLEVQQERDSLLTNIDNLEISINSLSSDLEGSLQKISDLDTDLVNIRSENEFLSENLAKLRSEHLEVSDRASQSECEKDSLQREIAGLQEKLAEKFECKVCSETLVEVKKLNDLVGQAFPDQDEVDTSSSDSIIKCLERSLRKLVESYTTLSLEKFMTPDVSSGVHNNVMLEEQNLKELLDDKDQSLTALKVELDEASHSLAIVKEEKNTIIEKYHTQISELEALIVLREALKEERDIAIDKYQSLISEFEAMVKQRDSLQDQLNQEEQRSASIREKLNVAVRKGKGLVQQRDSLKQTVEELNSEFDRLKSELNQQVESLQLENNLLRTTLQESENSLHDHSQTLKGLLTALYSVEFGNECNTADPVQKMEWIVRQSYDLHAALSSAENEATKSKRAAELLVAELNEVQERADSFQEDLGKAEAALALLSRERDVAEAEKSNVVSQLEQFMIRHAEEKKQQLGSIIELKDGTFELRKGFLDLSNILANVLSRDVNLFCSMESSFESITKLVDSTNSVDLPILLPADLLSSALLSEDVSFSADGLSKVDVSEDVDSLISECIQVASHRLYECMEEVTDLKEKLRKHSFAVDQQVNDLCRMVEATQSRIASQELSSESLKRDVANFEMILKNKENELSSMHRNISFLYEACRKSILELENRRAQVVGKSGVLVKLPSWVHEEGTVEGQTSFNENFTRMVADSLLTTIKGLGDTMEEVAEEKERQIKATTSDFQRELQEKNIQQNRICAELVSQIREAEAVAKKFSVDLDSAKARAEELESQIEEMENRQKLSESRMRELKKLEASSKEYEQRIKSLTDSIAAKDQEIEGLMQALDEEESQMESLQSRNQELEQIVQQNNLALDNLEASRAKALTKLSTTLSRFDELHHLSENLLTEIENLQSQLQERDSEISFLRQEMARCTNDVLTKQESNKRVLTDLHEVQTWMNAMVLRLGGHKWHVDDQNISQIHSYIKYLDIQIPSVMAELEDLRVAVQNKDALLDIEKGRVNELSRRADILETSLREKESQIESSGGAVGPGQPSTVNTPDSLEINKRSTIGSLAPIARSGRRANTDQIAIAIAMDQENSALDDEDDDKAHGFKSLTASKIVPRATRPITDRIDGLWVAIDRLLMRQPTLRLGLIIYWVVLHALLAASI